MFSGRGVIFPAPKASMPLSHCSLFSYYFVGINFSLLFFFDQLLLLLEAIKAKQWPTTKPNLLNTTNNAVNSPLNKMQMHNHQPSNKRDEITG